MQRVAQLIGLAAVLVTVGGGFESAHAQQATEAAPAVLVAPVKTEDVTKSAEFVGNIQAIQQVEVRARVEGYIEKVLFKEGSMVKKGQPLFTIEKDTYQAAVDTAKASVAQAQAQLASAQAELTKNQLQLDRMIELRKSGTVSQRQLDDAQAARDESAAQVQQAKAAIQQAQAQLQTAQINLSYTDVNSPIAGRIGKANFTAGNLVDASSGVLATVVQTDPIRAVFSISDSDYLKVVEAVSDHKAETDSFIPRLRLPDHKMYDHDGKIAFIDNTVDPSTGTIAVYADYENPKQFLVPGQFVNVIVQLGEKHSLPVVPAAAVQQDRNGAFVFVLGKEDRVEERRIETSLKTSSGWAVSKGIQPGEVIVVSGIQKIKPGMVVTPSTATTES